MTVMMLTNATRQWHMFETCGDLPQLSCEISVWIWKTLPVIWLTLGTFGNVLNIVILSRPRLRTSSTTLYLLALSVSDLIALWTALLRSALLFACGIDIKILSSLNCSLLKWIATTAISFSIWMLVVLTIERVIYVQKPMAAKVMLTRKKAANVIIIMCVIFISCHSHLAYGFTLTTRNDSMTVHTNSTKVGTVKCTYISQNYALFFKHTYSALAFLILNVIPFVLIVTGNLIIAFTILTRRRNRSLHGAGTILRNRNTAVVRMLFLLSIVFLITTIPYSIYQIVLYRFKSKMSTDQFAHMKLVQAVIYNVFAVNFTFNFFLYFGSGSVFKNELLLMMRDIEGKCCKRRPDYNCAVNIPMTRTSTHRFLGDIEH